MSLKGHAQYCQAGEALPPTPSADKPPRMAPGAAPGIGTIPKCPFCTSSRATAIQTPFENGRLREHVQLLVAQRFNFLVQVQLLIRLHFPSAGRVQTCAPPGPAITRHRLDIGTTSPTVMNSLALLTNTADFFLRPSSSITLLKRAGGCPPLRPWPRLSR